MIYTFGYAGKKLETVKEKIEELDAVIWDIRFSPRSKDEQWRKPTLAKTLGQRYFWAGQFFGNKDYKGDTIQLADPEKGIQSLSSYIQSTGKTVVLMCFCWDYNKCHRKHVADLLRDHGYETDELRILSPKKRIEEAQAANQQISF